MGFSAVRTTTVNGKKVTKRGMTTAGHCYKNTHPAFTYVGRQYGGAKGDSAFYSVKSGHSVVGSFYANWKEIRAVKGVGKLAEGTKTCKFGQRTGTRCTHIVAINVKGHYPDATITGLARTSINYCWEGDNGGPVYWNNTALGMISGRSGKFLGKGLFSVIEPILRSQTKMSVQLIRG